MMMTRRSFLQALLSLPVVAAVPQFAALQGHSPLQSGTCMICGRWYSATT